MAATLAKSAKRWLYIVHRWIGIFTCILCAVWFVSGVVMMYVPYPALTAKERLAGLSPIDWSQVRLSPADALARAPNTGFPKELRLEQAGGAPVYRITEADGSRAAVSAVDGRSVGGVDAQGAEAVGRAFARNADVRWVRTVTRDQWTVAQRYNRDRPLHVIAVGDAAGTELYVSSTQGVVVADTHRTERLWNWLGSVPHWIYFTVIRQDADVWRQVIMWTSFPAVIGSAAGIWIGVLRMRVRRRYKGDRVSPYAGWMKWHHITGLIFGAFVVTWLVSGWLSVNPFGWFNRDGFGSGAAARYAAAPGRTHLAHIPDRLRQLGDVRELRFIWIAGDPRMIAFDGLGEPRLLDASVQPVRYSREALAAAAQRLMPDAPVRRAHWLQAEDAYWYSHHNERVLPVLRVEFADAAGSWAHIDPRTGLVAGETSRSGRTYRWMFNALHSFDFRPLLQHRPAWDLVVWTLSIGGLIISVSGVVIGWRRLKKDVRSTRAAAARRRPSAALPEPVASRTRT